MNLILFGFKNCGKTYLGKLLAEELNLSFIDVDALIEKTNGFPCPRLYKMVGKDTFRQMERDALASLRLVKNTIIGVGGGIILDPQNISFLEKIGQLIYLKADKELIKKRMFNQSTLPSFIDHEEKELSFEAMYQERLPLYEGVNAVTVDVTHKPKEALIKELKDIYYGK